MSCFAIPANVCRIIIRHEHAMSVDRLNMYTMPVDGVDLECSIVAWADGGPTDIIREQKFAGTTISNDMALLYCPTKLGMKAFPNPRKFHSTPNNTAEPRQSELLNMLAYNGSPNPIEDLPTYPYTAAKDILHAFNNLSPNYLSWNSGPSEASRSEPDTIFYRISTYAGASGAGIFDVAGNLVGSSSTLDAS